MTGGTFAWALWSVPVFLALTRVPRPPRTALPLRDQLARGLPPVAVSLLTLSLAAGLAWLLLAPPAPPANPDPVQWLQGPGLLFLLAAAGVWLLPLAFCATDVLLAFSLEPATRFMLGLAWASCWPAAWEAARDGNPSLFLLAAACSLLPDSLDCWIARAFHRTHIHIVPDPLAPDPGMIAGALAQAIERCRTRQETVRVRVYPGQTPEGLWHPYTLRFDNQGRHLVASHGATSAAAPLPCAITSALPFTMATGDGPLTIALEPVKDGRVRLRADPGERTWSHSLAMASGLALAAGLAAGPVAGAIAGGACMLHLIADQLGFTGPAWLYPLRREPATGIQLIRPSRQKAFSIGVIGLALLLVIWKGAGSGA